MDNSSVLKWHPSSNHYLFDNGDVLLVSSSGQWYLPALHFPLMQFIDGSKSADDILRVRDVYDPQTAAFFYFQIEQLTAENLLLDGDTDEQYQRPLFDTQKSVDIKSAEVHGFPAHMTVFNLSAFTLPEVFDGSEEFQFFMADIAVYQSCGKRDPLTLVFVDDLLDPRISDLPLNTEFIVIKVGGEKVWLTPKFGAAEFSAYHQLQAQLLDNQPVRKWLIKKWPERCHGYSFKVGARINAEQCQQLSGVLLKQLRAESYQLAVYDIDTSAAEYHDVVCSLQQHGCLSKRGPVKLESCLAVYAEDGGSRSISAEQTLDKLTPFISPITGVVSHLEHFESTPDAEVEIYRTSFFKSLPQNTQEPFDQNSFVQICLGKGVSPVQSQVSAVCEAIERVNAQFRGNEPLLKSHPDDLSLRYVPFQSLTPYSERQYLRFADRNDPESKRKQAVQPYRNEEIYWFETWSLTKEEHVYVPLTCCFTNIEIENEQTEQLAFVDEKYGRWHSNGASAGNTREEAILQGLCELIERDAVSIWWYNRVTRPPFELNKIPPEMLQPIANSLSKQYEFWVLDVTNDTGVPVMVAVGQHKQHKGFIFGFGCHLKPELAAQRALTELCQLIPVRNQKGAPFDFDAVEEGPYLYPAPERQAVQPCLLCSGDMKDDILSIVEQLQSLNYETLVLDYSREPVPLYTVKVFVPGLCHIWPQLANERLYQVPVKLHWQNALKDERSICQQGFYV
ncbi:hypothetical protein RJ45_15995 [Photobacterium gaetbulicola]|uniref:YcaO domain-containing protein n=2 Tax=Photobacterium gaetbulicola TaxID=1295392 RepID=A0A0B9G1V6_9GAMM|nr:hypothetical protein RJ45_15995 [Photobacterium gaetbulicola]